MTENAERIDRFSYALEGGIHRFTWQFAKHWLLFINLIMGLFITLPYLTPVFEYLGWHGVANVIHRAYRMTCHQLPERSFFVLGYQASLCHRCSAIWLTFLIGGIIFGLSGKRIKPLPFHWWILALIPIGLDGGTQLMGPFYEILPGWLLSGVSVALWIGLTAYMIGKKVPNWQYYLFVACFPAGMIFIHLTGTRLSNWQLRSITGTVFGLANAWMMYPLFGEAFDDLQNELRKKLFQNPKDYPSYPK